MRVCQFRHSGSGSSPPYSHIPATWASRLLRIGSQALVSDLQSPRTNGPTDQPKKTAVAVSCHGGNLHSNQQTTEATVRYGNESVSRPFRVIKWSTTSPSVLSFRIAPRPSPQPACTTPGCKLLGPHFRAPFGSCCTRGIMQMLGRRCIPLWRTERGVVRLVTLVDALSPSVETCKRPNHRRRRAGCRHCEPFGSPCVLAKRQRHTT